MVIVHVKRNDQSQFLIETSLTTSVEDLTKKIVAIYNGKLKIERICAEVEELAKYGTLHPPEILGLTEDQVDELKLKDTYGDKCLPSGGYTQVKDPIGRRNGKQPNEAMQKVLNNTVKEAKEMVSAKLAQCLTLKDVQKAIELLRGAVTIVYPMKLPPHDVIRMEFENIEDLSGTQASLEVLDPALAQLWFSGREMYREPDKTVGTYLGKIENCKVIVKITKKGQGPPGREAVISEEDRKQLMLHAYRRQEELKKLAKDDDDSYMDSSWADSGAMKRTFHGLNNISWRPK